MSDIHLQFEAIGTHWVVDLFQPPSSILEEKILEQIMNLIEKYDQVYSRFRADSLVTQMSQVAGTYELPEGGERLLELYYDLYQKTQGKFTPLVGQALVDAGYDAEYSLQPKKISIVPPWEEVISFSGRTLTLKKPGLLDFGAGGKGDLVDFVGNEFIKNGVTNFCVDAGGDILQRSSTGKKLKIGLENPLNTEEVIGVAQLSNASICGSAGNRRRWQGFHHIIDPTTRTSVENVLAVWVMADNALLADALATCLFFVPASELLQYYQFEYLLLDDQSRLEKSTSFPAEFFVQTT
jgi:thiamine biosynthesis lipoprotein